jgi:tRNA threonylcarbamoyladenosine biosynthesis protein TsaE
MPINMIEQHAATADEMMRLGSRAAAGMRPGDVIALCGGMGAGKTHWTKGLLVGLGSGAVVTSPTFGLVHTYPAGAVTVHHFDLYRLESPEELLALGWDEYLEAGGVVVAEWADKFPDLFPGRTRWLRFEIQPGGGRIIREGGG